VTIESGLMNSSEGPIEIVQGGQVPAVQAANPLILAHSLLRGRYWLAISLALIGAVVGAPAGRFSATPEYKSVGVIRVQPILPKILYQTEQNGVMPMFDAFIAAQVAQIQSRRVTDEAMLLPEWKALGRGLTPDVVAEFQRNLTVESPRGGPLIDVTFTDKDPKVAAVAVKAIIQTYERFYNDNETESGMPAMNLLENRRNELNAQLNSINDRILAIANDFGSSALQEVYEFKLSELNNIESQLHRAQIQTALAGPATAPTTGAAAQPMIAAVDADVALRDPAMHDLLRQKAEAARQVRLLEARYGANHPQVHDAHVVVNAIEQDVQRRMDELKEELARDESEGNAAASPGAITKQKLLENQEALSRLFIDLKRETMELGRKNLAIDKLRNDAQLVRERLEETKNRIEQLNLEKNVSGRIRIISYGDVPFKPDKDRRAALTVGGALGLAACGVGVVMLMGFMDRRMQHLDSARSRLKRIDRLLGVLPNLLNDFTDQAASSAHCVHHIRAMLQIRQRVTGHKTFAITSPSPGDGKTSLAITLGMSLAASGCRTLLIDCDMDGAGLTHKLGRAARKLIGQILLDHGLIGESRLEEALAFARQNGVRLGKALVQLNYLSESQITNALTEQRRFAPGLGDVLNGSPVQNAIISAGLPSLSILPLGSPPAAHSGRLSPASMRLILDHIASQFDVVLMDCGPILGSVEAAIVSAEADGVVMVVSRGGDRTAAENAVSLLISAGAEIEGVVFNRAEASDVAASVFSSSASIRPVSEHVNASVPERDTLVGAAVNGPIPPIEFEAKERQR
jgi:succinoglycan biosynthesis transport protein ExoP